MAKRYLFEDTDKPTKNDNLKFKKRANAPSSSSNFVLGRMIYYDGIVDGVQLMPSIKAVSGISRAVDVTNQRNGASMSSMPKMAGTKALTITFNSKSKITEEWFNRVEEGSYSYLSDLVLLLLNPAQTHFSRCYGIRDAFPSALNTSENNTESTENQSVSMTIEHAGVKAIDIGDRVTFSKFEEVPQGGRLDNYFYKVYIKDTENFYADSSIFELGVKYRVDNFFSK